MVREFVVNVFVAKPFPTYANFLAFAFVSQLCYEFMYDYRFLVR